MTRVSCETIYRLVRGDFKHSVDEYAIIDCRFAYEHDGGHIDGAISIDCKERLYQFYQVSSPIVFISSSSSSLSFPR